MSLWALSSLPEYLIVMSEQRGSPYQSPALNGSGVSRLAGVRGAMAVVLMFGGRSVDDDDFEIEGASKMLKQSKSGAIALHAA